MRMLKELHEFATTGMSYLKHAAPAAKARFNSQRTGQSVRAGRRVGDEGNSIVEFALILPVLMTLLTGILSFGSAMMNYESLTHATAEGARVLAADRGNTTNPCADVFSAITANAPTLVPANINLTVTMGGTSVNSTTCSGDQSLLTSRTTVTVSAQYPCNIGVYGVTITPGCQLSATISEYEY